METYRVEIHPDVISGGDDGDMAFEFRCGNYELGPHIRAIGVLQELFVPGSMTRLLVRTGTKRSSWSEVGSFDADNLFVAKE